MMRNHTIVCGLGKRGMAVVEQLVSNPGKSNVIGVEISPTQQLVKRLRKLGVPLVIGDASSEKVLSEARIEKAASLYALGPDDMVNCNIAMASHSICSIKNSCNICYIHIHEAELRDALQNNYKCEDKNKSQQLHFIDAYGPEAISLLVNHLPLDHDGISANDTREAHLVILGFGTMGRSLAIKAAQLGQFANQRKIRISIIDRKAEENRGALLFHHINIDKVAHLSFYQQEAISPETRILVEKWCNQKDKVVSIAVCFDDQPTSYELIFSLLPVLNKKNVRTAIRVNEPENFSFLLDNTKKDYYEDLTFHAFTNSSSYQNLTLPEQNITEKFAMDIHKAYVALTKDQYADMPDKLVSLRLSGAFEEWSLLDEDLRESNRQQAAHISFKIRAVGFEIVEQSDTRSAIDEFPEPILTTLAMMEHNRWMAERMVNNWQYGEHKCLKQKLSPNLVKWNEMSDKIKKYDYETVKLIPKLLASMGKKIVLIKTDDR